MLDLTLRRRPSVLPAVAPSRRDWEDDNGAGDDDHDRHAAAREVLAELQDELRRSFDVVRQANDALYRVQDDVERVYAQIDTLRGTIGGEPEVDTALRSAETLLSVLATMLSTDI